MALDWVRWVRREDWIGSVESSFNKDKLDIIIVEKNEGCLIHACMIEELYAETKSTRVAK